MKKPNTLINFLIINALGLFFFSCSKRSDLTPGPASIVGRWSIIADTAHTAGYAPYIIVGINAPYMQFNADGSGTQKYNMSLPDLLLTFTYKVSKDTLFLSYPAQPAQPSAFNSKALIKKLTPHNLDLSYDIMDPTLQVTEHFYLSR